MDKEHEAAAPDGELRPIPPAHLLAVRAMFVATLLEQYILEAQRLRDKLAKRNVIVTADTLLDHMIILDRMFY